MVDKVVVVRTVTMVRLTTGLVQVVNLTRFYRVERERVTFTLAPSNNINKKEGRAFTPYPLCYSTPLGY